MFTQTIFISTRLTEKLLHWDFSNKASRKIEALSFYNKQK